MQKLFFINPVLSAEIYISIEKIGVCKNLFIGNISNKAKQCIKQLSIFLKEGIFEKSSSSNKNNYQTINIQFISLCLYALPMCFDVILVGYGLISLDFVQFWL